MAVKRIAATGGHLHGFEMKKILIYLVVLPVIGLGLYGVYSWERFSAKYPDVSFSDFSFRFQPFHYYVDVIVMNFESLLQPDLGPLNPPVENPIYTRSECMVRTTVEYPEAMTNEEELRLSDDFWWSIQKAFRRKETHFPMASLSFGNEDSNSLYVIYSQNCDRKFQMTQSLIDFYHRDYPDGYKLTLTHDVVEPGYDTILMKCCSWTDAATKPSE